MLKMKMALAAAAIGFATLFAGQGPVQAASLPITPIPSVSKAVAPDASGLLQQVHYRRGGFCYRHPYNWRCRRGYHHRYYRHPVHYNHCYKWRHNCAGRWGWRTHNFYVCQRRHGC